MPGVTVELEPEVTAWLDSLADDEFGHVERYIEVRFTTATASGPLQPSQGGVRSDGSCEEPPTPESKVRNPVCQYV